jgi:CBS domain-containing protein
MRVTTLQQMTVLDAKRYGVLSCRAQETLHEAAQRMVEEDVSALVVVDDEDYLQGILTHTDLVRAAATLASWRSQPVAAFMSRDVITVPAGANLAAVVQRLLDHYIHRVVVIREENGRQRPIAVIASSDIVYHLVRQ